jgi:hypothetical protein
VAMARLTLDFERLKIVERSLLERPDSNLRRNSPTVVLGDRDGVDFILSLMCEKRSLNCDFESPVSEG